MLEMEDLPESSHDLDCNMTDNCTSVSSACSGRHLTLQGQVLITFFYGFGIGANAFALILLARRETARNRKQSLMVRCLAYSDLVALLGSLVLMHVQLYVKVSCTQCMCALRVLLRTFGLSSGCVAIVMAAERWMALTRPFLYQKHVTSKLIKRAIFTLWLVALLLVCLPFAGFGLYYYEDSGECARYRDATRPADVAYAFLMFGFGLLLCAVIVACNLAVVRALRRMGKRSGAHRTTVRKESRELAFDHATPEELSFAKLMIVLCVFFVCCWVPQMVTIVMAQVKTHTCPGKDSHPFYRLADILMALNFTLDPVVYVLSRRPHRRGLRELLKPLCQSCWSEQESRKNSSNRSSQGRIPTPYGSKITKEVNQNSLSSSSNKETIMLQQQLKNSASKL